LTRAVRHSNLQNPFVKLPKDSMALPINLRRLHQTVNLLLRLRAMLQAPVIVDIRDIRHHMVKAHLHHHFWHPIVILETFATLATLVTPRVLFTAIKMLRPHRLIKM
jgi:hypothetical protein